MITVPPDRLLLRWVNIICAAPHAKGSMEVSQFKNDIRDGGACVL